MFGQFFVQVICQENLVFSFVNILSTDKCCHISNNLLSCCFLLYALIVNMEFYEHFALSYWTRTESRLGLGLTGLDYLTLPYVRGGSLH